MAEIFLDGFWWIARFVWELGAGTEKPDAGHIGLRASVPRENLSTPAALNWNVSNDVQVVDQTGWGGGLSFTAPDGEVVIERDAVEPDRRYTVRFRHPNHSGHFREYVVEKVSPGAGLDDYVLRVTEKDGNGVETRVWQFEYEKSGSEGGWKMANGFSGGTALSWSSKTERWNALRTRRTETQVISEDDGTVRYHEETVFDRFDWGMGKTKRTVAPGGTDAGPELVTEWTYHDDGRVKSRRETGGSWEVYGYDGAGRLTERKSVFKDSYLDENDEPVGPYRLWERFHDTADLNGDNYADSLVRTVESVVDDGSTIEISRRYRIEWGKPETIGSETFIRISEIRVAAPGGIWDDAGNLETVHYYHGMGGNHAGRLYRTDHPDGTITLHQHTSANGLHTDIVRSGVPNAARTDIVRGTRSERLASSAGHLHWRRTFHVAPGQPDVLVLDEEATVWDDFGRPTEILHLDGAIEEREFTCCGHLRWHKGRDGVVTENGYDLIGRLNWTQRAGVTLNYELDAAGRRIGTIRQKGTPEAIEIERRHYDRAGRLVWSENALGFVLGGSREEWVATYRNMLGQQVRTEHPDGAIESRTFNDKGQLVRVYRGPSPETTGPEVEITLFAYNELGEQEYTVVDIAQTIDPANWDVESEKGGVARITRTTNEVVASLGRHRSTTTVWTKDGNVNATETVRISERSVSGLNSWQTDFGVTTHTEITLDGQGGRTVRTNRADDSYRLEIFQDDRLQSVVEYDANDQQLEETTFQYDPHGRLWRTIDARNGSTEYTYLNDDQVKTVATPDPDPSRSEVGWVPQVTEFEYDERGRRNKTIHPDNTETLTTYWPTGQVRRVSGSRTFPVEYTYDAQGRMRTMKTWRDYDVPGDQEGTIEANTTWVYDAEREWLTEKIDEDGKKTVYTYDALGRLRTRTWDRGPVTTYGYTAAGELWSITYDDQTIDLELRAADVEIEYDRRGLRESVTETRGNAVVSARTFTYADHWQLEEEEWTDGILAGFTLRRDYSDSLNRLTGVSLKEGSNTIVAQEIDYAPGRPHIVSVSDLTVPALPVRADFTIEPNSRMIANTKFYHDQTLRHEVTRQRDAINRLVSIGSSAASFVYDYNAANQRQQVTTEDDNYWRWKYDPLGQLESARRHRPNGQKVLGHDFAFVHDTIGNRTLAVRNTTPSSYTPNLLNQYEKRDVPGIIHILGTADPEATVTVDRRPTLRQDALFYAEYPVNNGSGPVHETIQIRGVKIEDGVEPKNHVSDAERKVFVVGTPESFDYDTDGNLVQDGRWNYIWNAENRLVRMETRPGLPPSLVRQRLDFSYDSDGRRIRKSVSQWDDVTNDFVPVSAIRYLYNGWNLLAEIDEADSLIRSYLWGPSDHGQYELTATPGALLGLRDHTNNDAFFFAQSDGNGNITNLIAALDGTEAARYEYGPFGEPLRATGPMAQANPLRFSSKFVDAETGLYYYGYRYYSPSMGRFLNRDPIEEAGGLNLYAFVGNDPVNRWDWLGLGDYKLGDDDPTITPDAGAGVHGSESPTIRARALRRGIQASSIFFGWPNARAHLNHYFGGSGADYTIRLNDMIRDVPSAQALMEYEIALAQAFAEGLNDGNYSITSGSASGGYNTKAESEDWYYAVGGYSAWGKGNARVCGDRYVLQFEYKFYDRYNWDTGKSVTITVPGTSRSITVTDAFMGQFHRMGLAQEFDMNGSVKKTIEWRRGEAPEIRDGWNGGGR